MVYGRGHAVIIYMCENIWGRGHEARPRSREVRKRCFDTTPRSCEEDKRSRHDINKLRGEAKESLRVVISQSRDHEVTKSRGREVAKLRIHKVASPRIREVTRPRGREVTRSRGSEVTRPRGHEVAKSRHGLSFILQDKQKF